MDRWESSALCSESSAQTPECHIAGYTSCVNSTSASLPYLPFSQSWIACRQSCRQSCRHHRRHFLPQPFSPLLHWNLAKSDHYKEVCNLLLAHLWYGVPEGSILGPLVFSVDCWTQHACNGSIWTEKKNLVVCQLVPTKVVHVSGLLDHLRPE